MADTTAPLEKDATLALDPEANPTMSSTSPIAATAAETASITFLFMGSCNLTGFDQAQRYPKDVHGPVS